MSAGISLDCAVLVFETWLQEKDVKEICSALKKTQLDNRLQVGTSG